MYSTNSNKMLVKKKRYDRAKDSIDNVVYFDKYI